MLCSIHLGEIKSICIHKSFSVRPLVFLLSVDLTMIYSMPFRGINIDIVQSSKNEAFEYTAINIILQITINYLINGKSLY